MTERHDRVIRATFWSDGELLTWPLDKRVFYALGLPALCEWTGCLVDDPASWKWDLFPADTHVTAETLSGWRDELLADGKLIAYSVQDHRYLYLPAFHRYQQLPNVGRPRLPWPTDHLEVRRHSTDSRKWEIYDTHTGVRIQPRSPKNDSTDDLPCDSPTVGQSLRGSSRGSVKGEGRATHPTEIGDAVALLVEAFPKSGKEKWRLAAQVALSEGGLAALEKATNATIQAHPSHPLDYFRVVASGSRPPAPPNR